MKNKLKEYVGKRLQFTGVFEELTYSMQERAYVVLVKPVRFRGARICNHAWILLPKENNSLKDVEVNRFDKISFTAEVEAYIKNSGEEDYGLCKMESVYVFKKREGDIPDPIEKIQALSFEAIMKGQFMRFGQEKKSFAFREDREISKGVFLKEGEKIECLFCGINNNRLQFKLRTEHMENDCWISNVSFNPLQGGQWLEIGRERNKVLLPHYIYSDLKRAYFKIFGTKTEFSIQTKEAA